MIVKTTLFILLIMSLGVISPLFDIDSFKPAYSQVPQDTFSASGVILSSVSNTYQAISHAGVKSAAPTTNSAAPQSTTSSYRLNGTWLLAVDNGLVTNFKAIAAMIPVNRTNNNTNNNANNHTYEISNFQNQKNGYAQLYPNGVAFIVGKSDVKVDGNTKWKNVQTVLIIDSLIKFKVSLDSNSTNNLFNGQPIEGLTQSLKNSLGMPIISGKTLPTSGGTEGQQQQQQLLGTDNNAPSQEGPLLQQQQHTNRLSGQNMPGQLNPLNQGPSTPESITNQPSQNQGSSLSQGVPGVSVSPPSASPFVPPQNTSPQNQAHPID